MTEDGLQTDEQFDPWVEELLSLYEQQLAQQSQSDPRRDYGQEQFWKAAKDPPWTASEDFGALP